MATPVKTFLIRAGGREFRLSVRAIKNYYAEYGLTKEEFSLEECLQHLAGELAGARAEAIPTSLQAKKPRTRMRSANLVFTFVGDTITIIRISQRYSPPHLKKQRKEAWRRPEKLRA